MSDAPTAASKSAGGGIADIPGVRKGVARPGTARPAAVFRVGDSVRHRVFGPGRIVDLTGAGEMQRVRVRFSNGSERSFYANAAPIIKLEG